MPCLANTTLDNDGNLQDKTLWVIKMLNSMISAKT